MAQVRAEELVLGPADIEGAAGPWVQLSHLVVGDVPADLLPAGSDGAPEQVLANLRTLAPTDRSKRFGELVTAANAVSARSGELGYFVKEQLIAPVGTAAHDPAAKRFDVIGPITTDAGPELFLVEAQYRGALNDEVVAALMAASSGERSFLSIAQARSSTAAARSVGGPWRSRSELDERDPATRELFETPVGAVTSPFELEGELVIARIVERRDALIEHDAIERAAVTRWSSWQRAARQAATVVWADAVPTASASGGEIPTMLPQETPRIPVAPGSGATP